MKEYVYKLILVDRLFVEDNWTDEDEAIIGRHFAHLQSLQKNNQLILAGKTAGLDNNTYGLVLFTAKDDKDAEAIMNRDPAIVEGIMTGTLQEYNVALFNPTYKKE
ncbi:YciI family protein [Candidatus Xianfuyuplasma coldseepsis]|uniref:YCII-related domain-containing protein n=1 Tax=Candidatus Xianfuyuplasma coldseepsis TaxID=2782163 RepID=A0A7L7KPG1_9MOLU|nr:YciI family protein [Xianfuyuplasma coldseepsis]QMS84583.1 hypothetical protein G4Z02_02065 [Xianfuyuplasma coldseepsis]